jgi:hypothetical protein
MHCVLCAWTGSTSEGHPDMLRSIQDPLDPAALAGNEASASSGRSDD